ncbi:MAG: hypothetical protein ACRDBQ_01560 [Shewanella sp.]
MKLNIVNQISPPLTAADVVIDGRTMPPVLSNPRIAELIDTLKIERLQTHRTLGDIALTEVQVDWERWSQREGITVLIVFQFKGTESSNGVAALSQYIDDRSSSLAKYGGKIIFSGLSERSEKWPFNGFEIIEFPNDNSVLKLMEDSDYLEKVATSIQVFGGLFAMLPFHAYAESKAGLR